MEAALEAAVRPLLLLSIVIVTFGLPPWWLRRNREVRYAPMLLAMIGCVLAYVVALIVILPRLS